MDVERGFMTSRIQNLVKSNSYEFIRLSYMWDREKSVYLLSNDSHERWHEPAKILITGIVSST